MDVEPVSQPLLPPRAPTRRDWLIGATSAAVGCGAGIVGSSLSQAWSNPRRKLLEADEIFQRVKKSVFVIKTKDGLGTGFCIDTGLRQNNSVLMTARHVIGWDVVASAAMKDLGVAAVLTQRGDEFPLEPPWFSVGPFDLFSCCLATRVVPLAIAAQEPEIGEAIYVLGHPNGIRYVFSSGIVSSYDLDENGQICMMITAPISPGNSGGPVFNRHGEVVGMIVSTRTDGQNLNYAVVPHELVAQRERMRFLLRRIEPGEA